MTSVTLTFPNYKHVYLSFLYKIYSSRIDSLLSTKLRYLKLIRNGPSIGFTDNGPPVDPPSRNGPRVKENRESFLRFMMVEILRRLWASLGLLRLIAYYFRLKGLSQPQSPVCALSFLQSAGCFIQ